MLGNRIHFEGAKQEPEHYSRYGVQPVTTHSRVSTTPANPAVAIPIPKLMIVRSKQTSHFSLMTNSEGTYQSIIPVQYKLKQVKCFQSGHYYTIILSAGNSHLSAFHRAPVLTADIQYYSSSLQQNRALTY